MKKQTKKQRCIASAIMQVRQMRMLHPVTWEVLHELIHLQHLINSE